MADDTNNNFVVTGATMNASIATDYSTSESSHFQVVKVAFGDSGTDGIRVSDTTGLPVEIIQSVALDVTSISNPVTVTGTVGVHGVAGATAVGITATNFDIRGITHTRDSIRVLGGVTVTNGEGDPYATGISPFVGFQTRLLRATNNATAVQSGSALQTYLLSSPSAEDTVRVVGLSGAYPVGVTAVDLDIRSLTFGSDSVSVLNTAKVENGTNSSATPFSTTITDGFQTRVLRATTGADAATSAGALTVSTVEDTVRVVGLSGAYPVSVVPSGLTGITNAASRVPFRVDDTGALYVALAAGTIGVTANITSSSFTLVGVSLSNAGSSAGVVQVQGYNGSGAIAVGITAHGFDIRPLSTSTDSVFAQTRLLGGACADSVDLGGTAGLVMEKFNSAIGLASGVQRLNTTDANSSNINTGVSGLCGAFADLVTNKLTLDTTLGSGIKVSVVGVAQPSGMTSGKIPVPINTSAATNLASKTLQSGIHFKSDLSNTSGTIFIGSDAGVTGGNGYPLYNGDQIFIETDNSNRIFVSATVAGLTLYYIGT